MNHLLPVVHVERISVALYGAIQWRSHRESFHPDYELLEKHLRIKTAYELPYADMLMEYITGRKCQDMSKISVREQHSVHCRERGTLFAL